MILNKRRKVKRPAGEAMTPVGVTLEDADWEVIAAEIPEALRDRSKAEALLRGYLLAEGAPDGDDEESGENAKADAAPRSPMLRAPVESSGEKGPRRRRF